MVPRTEIKILVYLFFKEFQLNYSLFETSENVEGPEMVCLLKAWANN